MKFSIAQSTSLKAISTAEYEPLSRSPEVRLTRSIFTQATASRPAIGSPSISAEPSITYYPEAGAAEDETTFEAYIGAEFDVTLSPSVYVYYDFDLETLTVEGSVKHKYKLAKFTYLKSKAYLGGYDPESGKSKYYLGAKTGVVYNFT